MIRNFKFIEHSKNVWQQMTYKLYEGNMYSTCLSNQTILNDLSYHLKISAVVSYHCSRWNRMKPNFFYKQRYISGTNFINVLLLH